MARMPVTVRRINFAALGGWIGALVGVLSLAIQCFRPSIVGLLLSAVGGLIGALVIRLAGPLWTVSHRQIHVETTIQSSSGREDN